MDFDTNKSIFYWHGQKIWMLEMSIKRKWDPKVLPLANIIFKKYKEKDEFFNSQKYLEEVDQEKYFELLRTWKDDFEKTYLEEYPHLRFLSVRHEKTLWDTRRKIKGLRVQDKILNIFLNNHLDIVSI